MLGDSRDSSGRGGGLHCAPSKGESGRHCWDTLTAPGEQAMILSRFSRTENLAASLRLSVANRCTCMLPGFFIIGQLAITFNCIFEILFEWLRKYSLGGGGDCRPLICHHLAMLMKSSPGSLTIFLQKEEICCAMAVPVSTNNSISPQSRARVLLKCEARSSPPDAG